MHEFILHRINTPDTQLLLDVNAAHKDSILAELTRFKLRKAVNIDDVTQDFCVAVNFPTGASEEPFQGLSSGEDVPQVPKSKTEAGRLPWDPRLVALGRRGVVLRSECVSYPNVAGSFKTFDAMLQNEQTSIRYAQLRYQLGVAEGDEMAQGMQYL